MTNVIAYRLSPVRDVPAGGIATAAVMTCMATGEILYGMGGGGSYLSAKVVEALRDEGAKSICNSALLDDVISILRRAARGEGVEKDAVDILERWNAACA